MSSKGDSIQSIMLNIDNGAQFKGEGKIPFAFYEHRMFIAFAVKQLLPLFESGNGSLPDLSYYELDTSTGDTPMKQITPLPENIFEKLSKRDGTAGRISSPIFQSTPDIFPGYDTLDAPNYENPVIAARQKHFDRDISKVGMSLRSGVVLRDPLVEKTFSQPPAAPAAAPSEKVMEPLPETDNTRSTMEQLKKVLAPKQRTVESTAELSEELLHSETARLATCSSFEEKAIQLQVIERIERQLERSGKISGNIPHPPTFSQGNVPSLDLSQPRPQTTQQQLKLYEIRSKQIVQALEIIHKYIHLDVITNLVLPQEYGNPVIIWTKLRAHYKKNAEMVESYLRNVVPTFVLGPKEPLDRFLRTVKTVYTVCENINGNKIPDPTKRDHIQTILFKHRFDELNFQMVLSHMDSNPNLKFDDIVEMLLNFEQRYREHAIAAATDRYNAESTHSADNSRRLNREEQAEKFVKSVESANSTEFQRPYYNSNQPKQSSKGKFGKKRDVNGRRNDGKKVFTNNEDQHRGKHQPININVPHPPIPHTNPQPNRQTNQSVPSRQLNPPSKNTQIHDLGCIEAYDEDESDEINIYENYSTIKIDLEEEESLANQASTRSSPDHFTDLHVEDIMPETESLSQFVNDSDSDSQPGSELSDGETPLLVSGTANSKPSAHTTADDINWEDPDVLEEVEAILRQVEIKEGLHPQIIVELDRDSRPPSSLQSAPITPVVTNSPHHADIPLKSEHRRPFSNPIQERYVAPSKARRILPDDTPPIDWEHPAPNATLENHLGTFSRSFSINLQVNMHQIYDKIMGDVFQALIDDSKLGSHKDFDYSYYTNVINSLDSLSLSTLTCYDLAVGAVAHRAWKKAAYMECLPIEIRYKLCLFSHKLNKITCDEFRLRPEVQSFIHRIRSSKPLHPSDIKKANVRVKKTIDVQLRSLATQWNTLLTIQPGTYHYHSTMETHTQLQTYLTEYVASNLVTISSEAFTMEIVNMITAMDDSIEKNKKGINLKKERSPPKFSHNRSFQHVGRRKARNDHRTVTYNWKNGYNAPPRQQKPEQLYRHTLTEKAKLHQVFGTSPQTHLHYRPPRPRYIPARHAPTELSDAERIAIINHFIKEIEDEKLICMIEQETIDPPKGNITWKGKLNDKSSLVLDTGASIHLFRNPRLFFNIRKKVTKVRFGNGQVAFYNYVGDAGYLHDVVISASASRNLVSGTLLMRLGFQLDLSTETVSIRNAQKELISTGSVGPDGLIYLNDSNLISPIGNCYSLTSPQRININFNPHLRSSPYTWQYAIAYVVHTFNRMNFKRLNNQSVSLSTSRSEIRALVNTIEAIIWYRNLLKELVSEQTAPTVVYHSNLKMVNLADLSLEDQHSKYIITKIHFIREAIDLGIIIIKGVNS